jgi:hypothetical protein
MANGQHREITVWLTRQFGKTGQLNGFCNLSVQEYFIV